MCWGEDISYNNIKYLWYLQENKKFDERVDFTIIKKSTTPKTGVSPLGINPIS